MNLINKLRIIYDNKCKRKSWTITKYLIKKLRDRYVSR
jgi:hypothetical protein